MKDSLLNSIFIGFTRPISWAIISDFLKNDTENSKETEKKTDFGKLQKDHTVFECHLTLKTVIVIVTTSPWYPIFLLCQEALAVFFPKFLEQVILIIFMFAKVKKKLMIKLVATQVITSHRSSLVGSSRTFLVAENQALI